MSELSQAEVDALHAALDDEYHAWTIYDQVLHDFGEEVRPFVHIVESEARHIRALQRLFERYHLPIPTNPWPGRVERYHSLRAACEAGVQAEIDNAALYDRLIASTARPDLLEVFDNLREASQQRHLRAFRRGATRNR
jgi:hypothetical protein